MVKIILILALLQYISNFLFGYKSNMLVCGIFGQATNKPENLDVNGVHILGIYNIERGKMSCGLSWDGDVYYGLGADKLYTDFIINRTIKPEITPIIIGHTRQPSVGMAITEKNAHPFGFGANKSNTAYGMVFCHNGTLKNHKELAAKYDIEVSEKVIETNEFTKAKYEISRTKIDSEILGEILYKTKNYHVLSEYVGAAACVWTWLDEPNKIYLWSGASKHTQGSQHRLETEERPMNVYCKDDNNMFFSSIPKSLTILGAEPNSKMQIDYNTVYIITDGDFKNAEKIKVSRLLASQNEKIEYTNYSRHYPGIDDWDDYRNFTPKPKTNVIELPFKNSMINLQHDQTLKPISEYIDKVYSKSLRYYCKGLAIQGIYIYIKGYGFKLTGQDRKSSDVVIKNAINKDFSLSYGYFREINVDNYRPITGNLENIQRHYFFNGVMLKTEDDYLACLKLSGSINNKSNDTIDVESLSFMSKHPIINMNPYVTKSVAMLDGKPYTGAITELGFEKVYYFNAGSLTKWTKREDLVEIQEKPSVNVEKQTNFREDVLKASIQSIVEFEKEYQRLDIDNTKSDDYCDLPDSKLDEEATLKELIMESFEKHREDLQETLIELQDYKESDIAKPAIETLKLMSHTLKDFLK